MKRYNWWKAPATSMVAISADDPDLLRGERNEGVTDLWWEFVVTHKLVDLSVDPTQDKSIAKPTVYSHLKKINEISAKNMPR